MRAAGIASLAAALIASCLPASADAAPNVEFVISQAGAGADGSATVDILIVNGGAAETAVALPDRIEGRLTARETRTVWLDRAAGSPATVTVAAGGFARARYRLAQAPGGDGADVLIDVPAWTRQQVALAPQADAAPAQLAAAEPARPPVAPPIPDGTLQSRNEEDANAFFGNVSAYEPSYIVFGTARDSEWRVQISFKYRLFGSRREDGLPSWHDGLYFGFTNKLFWDLASDASFRDTNYLPELFYRTRAVSLAPGIDAGIQAGIQHESNGRSGKIEGRSANNVYVAPMVGFDLGGGYRLSAAPRLSLLIGGKAGNPDIVSYRGATSLNLQVGKDDGLRLALSSRYNVSTGRGALSTELSYPLPALLGGGPEFYLFAQNFVGYGESLLDYDRRMTRLRIGFAIAR